MMPKDECVHPAERKFDISSLTLVVNRKRARLLKGAILLAVFNILDGDGVGCFDMGASWQDLLYNRGPGRTAFQGDKALEVWRECSSSDLMSDYELLDQIWMVGKEFFDMGSIAVRRVVQGEGVSYCRHAVGGSTAMRRGQLSQGNGRDGRDRDLRRGTSSNMSPPACMRGLLQRGSGYRDCGVITDRNISEI